MESEPVRKDQKNWGAEFDFLPVKVARVHRKFDLDSRTGGSLKEPEIDEDDFSTSFEEWRRYYSRTRPKTGSRSENDGKASLVTLIHYGLLDATGYDTGVIRSLNSEVLASCIAAARDEDGVQINHYLDQDEAVLKEMLENEFSEKFGTPENPDPVDVRGSVGGISAEICAMLRVLDRADPLEATRKELDGETL